MKATGIVRRIDDLGRVVIPKEIRRTQMIRVGDPLEIFVSGAGEVVFKKYSPMGELSSTAVSYAEVLSKSAGVPTAIMDRDRVLAAGGVLRDLADKAMSNAYTQLVERRRLFTVPSSESVTLCDSSSQGINAMMPILCNGDLIGSVAMVTAGTPTESEITLLRVAAAFLGRQLEE